MSCIGNDYVLISINAISALLSVLYTIYLINKTLIFVYYIHLFTYHQSPQDSICTVT